MLNGIEVVVWYARPRCAFVGRCFWRCPGSEVCGGLLVWKTQAARFILSKDICSNIVDHI